MTSFYTEKELPSLGLKKYGRNVKISRHASIYGAQNISIGDNVRIDDFCILSGHIELGSYIHIAAYSRALRRRSGDLHLRLCQSLLAHLRLQRE